MKKSSVFIIIVIILVIAGVIFFIKNNSSSNTLEYSTVKLISTISAKTNIIDNYDDLAKIAKKNEFSEVTKNYKKILLSDIYNESFFENKQLAFLQVYQDTSKDYISSIEKVEYNDSKTEVTIYYSNTGTYSGNLGKSWYYTYFIELDKTVTKVNFVFDNNSTTKN